MTSEPNEPKAANTESGAPSGGAGSRPGEWLHQLQVMIDELSTQAGPVLRDVAAKAAELAAKAGEAAGPLAHKAAEVTTDLGQKVAEKSREVAADLRRSGTQEPASPPAAGDLPATPAAPTSAGQSAGESTTEPEPATAGRRGA